MPTSNQTIQRERRKLLIDATITAIAGFGLSKLTLAKISSIAGLTAGTVNFHFDSKESLLLETLNFVSEEFDQSIALALEQSGPNPSQRLAAIINASIRQALGNVPLNDIISGERAALMAQIRDIVNNEADDFGIDVIDVRIKRGDLPEANSEAVFRRMQTEREREAKELRAEGAEEAQKLRAIADRKRVILIAEAKKLAQITRGEGDSTAIRIFADAFGQDVEFFSFYRSMEAYSEALGSDNTTMVLSPDSEFFRYFGDIGGKLQGDAAD